MQTNQIDEDDNFISGSIFEAAYLVEFSKLLPLLLLFLCRARSLLSSLCVCLSFFVSLRLAC